MDKQMILAQVPNILPKHIAMIMDGNGRWAKSKFLPRSAGHRAGVKALRPLIRMSSDIGIEVLTLYAFSTENWKRPKNEVKVLVNLLVEFLHKEINELNEENVCIHFMGEIESFPQRCIDAIKHAINLTTNNTGLIVNIALNYGSRQEIVKAVKLIAENVKNKIINIEDIDETMISANLYTATLPDPDLIIRTSGEKRLSNFMLYQSSYAEFYSPELYWPDFDEKAYIVALKEYDKRNRRFGDIEVKQK